MHLVKAISNQRRTINQTMMESTQKRYKVFFSGWDYCILMGFNLLPIISKDASVLMSGEIQNPYGSFIIHPYDTTIVSIYSLNHIDNNNNELHLTSISDDCGLLLNCYHYIGFTVYSDSRHLYRCSIPSAVCFLWPRNNFFTSTQWTERYYIISTL